MNQPQHPNLNPKPATEVNADSQRPRPADTRPTTGSAALREFRDATRRWERPQIASQPRTRISGWLALAVAGVAAVLAFAVGHATEYRCRAVIKVDPLIADDLVPVMYQALAGEYETRARDSRDIRPWAIRRLDTGELALFGTTPSDASATEDLRQLAQALVDAANREYDNVAGQPDRIENLLRELADKTEAWARSLGETLDSAAAMLPTIDPTGKRTDLLNRWDTLRTRYANQRRAMVEAADRLVRLQSTPPPESGTIDPGDRAKALAADEPLQQDLAELNVRLAGLRTSMRSVSTESETPLADITGLATDLAGVIRERLDTADGTTAETLEEMQADLATYRAGLAIFEEKWTEAVGSLGRLPVDSTTDALLTAHEDAREAYGDFIFGGARELGLLRRSAESIGNGEENLARFHVLRSLLVRGVEKLRAAHDRFEFHASGIDARKNFRLEAALNASYGLYRRTQQRTAIIDRRLAANAAERARREHAAELVAAEQALRDLRSEVDTTTEDLLSVQQELNLTLDESQAFARATAIREVAGDQLEKVATESQRIRDSLALARQKRLRFRQAVPVRLDDVRATRVEAYVGERLQFAGGTAVLAFLATALVQWHALRRRHVTPA